MLRLPRNTSTKEIERSILSCQEEMEQVLRDGAVDKVAGREAVLPV